MSIKKKTRKTKAPKAKTQPRTGLKKEVPRLKRNKPRTNKSGSKPSEKDRHKTDMWPRTRPPIYGKDAAARERVITELFKRYRGALISYLAARVGGFGHSWIIDIVDDFIANKFWKEEFLRRYDPTSGNLFRQFLMGCMLRYAIDQIRRERGRKKPAPTTESGATSAASDHVPYHQILPLLMDLAWDGPGPDQGLDREWARRVFDLAMEDMEAYCKASETRRIIRAIFERCCVEPLQEHHKVESRQATRDHIKQQFGKSLKLYQVSNYRKRGASMFGEHVRDVVSDTSSSSEQIDQELAYFIKLLGEGLDTD